MMNRLIDTVKEMIRAQQVDQAEALERCSGPHGFQSGNGNRDALVLIAVDQPGEGLCRGVIDLGDRACLQDQQFRALPRPANRLKDTGAEGFGVQERDRPLKRDDPDPG